MNDDLSYKIYKRYEGIIITIVNKLCRHGFEREDAINSLVEILFSLDFNYLLGDKNRLICNHLVQKGNKLILRERVRQHESLGYFENDYRYAMNPTENYDQILMSKEFLKRLPKFIKFLDEEEIKLLKCYLELFYKNNKFPTNGQVLNEYYNISYSTPTWFNTLKQDLFKKIQEFYHDF